MSATAPLKKSPYERIDCSSLSSKRITLRDLNPFCKILTVDLFWRISSLNRFGWQNLYADEYL